MSYGQTAPKKRYNFFEFIRFILNNSVLTIKLIFQLASVFLIIGLAAGMVAILRNYYISNHLYYLAARTIWRYGIAALAAAAGVLLLVLLLRGIFKKKFSSLFWAISLHSLLLTFLLYRLNFSRFYPNFFSPLGLIFNGLIIILFYASATWTAGLIEKYFFPRLKKNALLLYAAAWILLFAAEAVCLAVPAGRGRTNLLLIVIDTLRKDHLGRYGYNLNTSPYLDRFSRNSLVLTRLYSTCSWTLPSMASIFTGKLPSEHGIMELPALDLSAGQVLPRQNMTITDILKNQGYHTWYIGANLWLSPEFGFTRNFDFIDVAPEYDAQTLTGQALKLLGERKSDRPFFLWLHYMDVHSPYQPPPAYHKLFADSYGPARPLSRGVQKNIPPEIKLNTYDFNTYLGSYDGEIAYTDKQLNRIFTYYRKHLEKNTILIFIADHGEEFMDHGGWEHSAPKLFNELIALPCYICLPPERYKQIAGQREFNLTVSTQHLLPTITDLLNINTPLPCPEFKSIFKLNGPGQSVPPVISEYHSGDTEVISIIKNDYKLIYYQPANYYTSYNLKTDIQEKQNNFDSLPPTVRRELLKILDKHLEQRKTGSLVKSQRQKIQISRKKLKILKSLGYLN